MMAASNTEVFPLFKKLCESVLTQTFSEDNQKSTNLQSGFETPAYEILKRGISHKQVMQQLVRTTFDLLLLRKWEWFGSWKTVLPPECECLAHTYGLHLNGMHEEASRLETAIGNLLGEGHPIQEKESILKFLALMAVEPEQQLPSRVVSEESGGFCREVYPSSLFEQLPAVNHFSGLQSLLLESAKLFESVPGSGFTGFFTSKSLGIDQSPSATTLFDGLIHSTTSDLNTPLDLPNIPSQAGSISLLKKKSGDSVMMTQQAGRWDSGVDEGEESTMDSTTSLSELLAVSEDVRLPARTWEGWEDSKQYLSESTQETLHHAVNVCLSRITPLAGIELPLETQGPGSYRQLIRLLDSLPADIMQPLEESGSISRAFARALSSIILYCQAQLHKLEEGSDLDLQATGNRIFPLVQFLAELLPNTSSCSKGLQLLDCLYSQASRVQGTAHYTFLLALLRQAATPYLQFVCQWVFQGRLDREEEFGLHAQEEFLIKRDHRYWTQGYTLTSPCTPHFLSQHADTILTAGKALNLLRICCPTHPLCGRIFKPPGVSIVISIEELQETGRLCEAYSCEVTEMAKKSEEERQKEEVAKEQQAQEVVVRARQGARDAAERVRILQQAQQERLQERKRSLHKELKEQMETARALRTEREEEERVADREMMEALAKREKVLSEQERALEEEARAELVAYYEELSQEAEQRRLRTEWMARRLELSVKRRTFLEREREQWERVGVRPDEEGRQETQEMNASEGNEGIVGGTTQPTDTETQSETREFLDTVRKEQRGTIQMWAGGMVDVTGESECIERKMEVSTGAPKGLEGTTSTSTDLMTATEPSSLLLPDMPPLITLPEPTIGNTPTHVPNTPLSLPTIGDSPPGLLPSVPPQITLPISDTGLTHPPLITLLTPTMGNIPPGQLLPPGLPLHLGLTQPHSGDGYLPSVPGVSVHASVVQETLYGTSASQEVTSGLTSQEVTSGLTPRSVTTMGQESPSLMQGVQYSGESLGMELGQQDGMELRQQGGMEYFEPPSTAQDIIYPTPTDDLTYPRPTRDFEPPSTAQDIIYPTPSDNPMSPRPTREFEPPSTAQDIIYPTPSDDLTSPRPTREFEPPSTAQDIIYPTPSDNPTSPRPTRDFEPPSTAQDIIYPTPTGDLTSPRPTREFEPPSTAQDIIYPTPSDDPTSPRPSRDFEPPSTAQDIIYPTPTDDRTSPRPTRDFEPPSTLQDTIYGRESVGGYQDFGTPRITSSRGHPPPSISQDVLYMRDSPHSVAIQISEESTTPRLKSSRGHPPPSVIQDIMYSRDSAPEMGARSSHGAAPTTTIEYKLYPGRYSAGLAGGTAQKYTPREDAATSEEIFPPFQPYKDSYPMLDLPPSCDFLSHILGAQPPSPFIDTDLLSLYPLSALLEESIALPILTQSHLVNSALVEHFTSECRISRHFVALKRFLLLEDGEFRHTLATKLFEELSFGRTWQHLCTPSFLNPLLASALDSSLHGQTPEASRVSFALKYKPQAIRTHAVEALEFLELRYKVEWPCNIVITDDSITKYNRVFQLLLQLKRASWALKNVFTHLNKCEGLEKRQHRQLQTYRHELQHFINVMEGYLMNQLFYLSWREFEVEISQNVHSLDQLIKAHQSFIDKAIFRCLLSKKAKPVMNIIQGVFGAILKFSAQLTTSTLDVQWSYMAMCDTHRRFREAAGLLIKVVTKLVQRGYQPHLEDFMLRLNFNSFYI